MKTDLSKFSIGDYKAGPKAKVFLWYFVNYFIFNSSVPYPYLLKAFLLKLFGAKVGKGLVMKPRIRIKNPWRLIIGDNFWVAEDVWIDNLENVQIGNNVCISQGAMLLTGNHDYTEEDFPYRLGKIILEDGVWVGAKAIVCPGIICRSHSVLTVNSVATREMEEMKIYSGNPALFIKNRIFNKQSRLL